MHIGRLADEQSLSFSSNVAKLHVKKKKRLSSKYVLRGLTIDRYLDKSRNYRKKLSPKNCAVIFDCRRGLICGDRLLVLVSSSVVLAIFYKGSPWLLLALAIRCIR